MLAAKEFHSLYQRPCPEIGTSAHNDPGRLTAGVGVNHSNSAGLAVRHVLVISPERFERMTV